MQKNVLEYLYEGFDSKAERTAFADDKETVTFADVMRESRQLGTFLSRSGIYRKPIVVFMNKHPREIVAFFGIITGGCFYVPIDEEMPAVRIKLILDNVCAPLMICDEDTEQKAAQLGFTGQIVRYDSIVSEGAPIDDDSIARIFERQIDTDPIYLVFTSGSTGVPKGVTACHRSVIDYIEQLSQTLGFGPDTVFGNQSPLYFDACLKELYPTLKFGATTYLIPRELFMFPVKLVEYINEHNINTICWVVSALTMISAFGTFKTVVPSTLRTIAFGSEVFPIKQLNRWREALPQASFTNLYGPTEGTGMCCYFHVDRDFELGESIPIGRPFSNTEILLLDEQNREVKFVPAGDTENSEKYISEGSLGTEDTEKSENRTPEDRCGTEDTEKSESSGVGEICIRGTSVTLGYYNNPEKTASAYVQNPLNTAYPEIIYRTGDLGRYNERGELMFVSRKDFQIKHMGHRIELGEIEANVQMIDGVSLAGCVYDSEKSRIVLCYVGEIESAQLTSKLKEGLPRYMLPNKIFKLDTMPLTANGKVDRVTLKKQYA